MKTKNWKLKTELLNLLFPSLCVNCHHEGDFYLCPECQKQILLASPQLFTPKSKKQTLHINTLIAPFIYRCETIEKLIHTLKYNAVQDIAHTISQYILKKLKPITIKIIKQNIHAITCIPLHQKRQNYRGFNQSDLIAKFLAKKLRIPYTNNLLTRNINTKPQAHLSRQKRLKNMINVFEFNLNFQLKDLNILIIDDVATTLSTLNQAAKTLKTNKANKIWGLTIARG